MNNIACKLIVKDKAIYKEKRAHPQMSYANKEYQYVILLASIDIKLEDDW